MVIEKLEPVMPIRVLIVGLGSIGQRHARLIQQHFPHELVALRSYSATGPNRLGIPEIGSWEQVDRQTFDAAIIANPTDMHLETAIHCAKRGMHLFIEKPIGCGLSGLDELIRLVAEKRLSAYVAYPLRFHPIVRRLKERLDGRTVLHASILCASFLPDWRPKQDHRASYSAFAGRGGGVFLDMSHELDLAEYCFGPILDIQGKLGRVSGVTVDSDDCADLILTQKHGVTNVHLNSFSQRSRRSIEIDTSDGYLSADLLKQSLLDIAGSAEMVETSAAGGDEMYLEQLRYFFANLGRVDMDNNVKDASSLYRKMIAFREAQWTP